MSLLPELVIFKTRLRVSFPYSRGERIMANTGQVRVPCTLASVPFCYFQMIMSLLHESLDFLRAVRGSLNWEYSNCWVLTTIAKHAGSWRTGSDPVELSRPLTTDMYYTNHKNHDGFVNLMYCFSLRRSMKVIQSTYSVDLSNSTLSRKRTR